VLKRGGGFPAGRFEAPKLVQGRDEVSVMLEGEARFQIAGEMRFDGPGIVEAGPRL